MKRPSKPKVLLIEDNPGDALLTTEALEAAIPGCAVTVVDNGADALDAVRADRPDLILLDLNLPGMSGHDVLAAIRADTATRRLPVVVLSSSGETNDVERAYEATANSYIQKPGHVDDLERVIEQMSRYWFETALLP